MSTLAQAAYDAGQAAAADYQARGHDQPPALDRPPYSLTGLLTGTTTPTPADCETVASNWTRGVRHRWDRSPS